MIVRPMTSREVAQRMGVSLDCFYRNREQYRATDGMPAPISTVGRMAWERTGMEVWLTRHHPMRPQKPANDMAAPPVPGSIEEHQAELHAYYASRRQLAP